MYPIHQSWILKYYQKATEMKLNIQISSTEHTFSYGVFVRLKCIQNQIHIWKFTSYCLAFSASHDQFWSRNGNRFQICAQDFQNVCASHELWTRLHYWDWHLLSLERAFLPSCDCGACGIQNFLPENTYFSRYRLPMELKAAEHVRDGVWCWSVEMNLVCHY